MKTRFLCLVLSFVILFGVNASAYADTNGAKKAVGANGKEFVMTGEQILNGFQALFNNDSFFEDMKDSYAGTTVAKQSDNGLYFINSPEKGCIGVIILGDIEAPPKLNDVPNTVSLMFKYETGSDKEFEVLSAWMQAFTYLCSTCKNATDTRSLLSSMIVQDGKVLSRDGMQYLYQFVEESNSGFIIISTTLNDAPNAQSKDSSFSWRDLIGYWSSRNGMHTFEMKDNGGYVTTVPVVPRCGDTYEMVDGVIYSFFASNPSKKTANLKITMISDNEIEIYSYQVKASYTLFKRR